MQDERFPDRYEAGRRLAGRLTAYRGRPDVVVLALPRGGVPVGSEVARALGARLDVLVVRKLGVPQQPELAMGAIASGGIRVLNDEVVSWYGVSSRTIEEVTRVEQTELKRREEIYREGRPPLEIGGRVAILVDDGLATGSTMRAAAKAVRQRGPSRLVVAVPVGAVETCREMAAHADEVVCARTPEPFSAVGLWYHDFSQTTDDEVRTLLRDAAGVVVAVRIPAEGADLDGDLRVPDGASGLVVFAHGSGSSRFSRRNRQVAEFLHARGFATLLLDLLTPEEEAVDIRTREFRFDIARLARRMVAAVDWAKTRPDVAALPLGCFGASTGAAAALIAAAERPDRVRAVVSRGGRPDLAGDVLSRVRAPTLLIVGGNDEPVIQMNRDAQSRMSASTDLEIVPGATHLFEEPGTLESVCRAAAGWFARHLRSVPG